MSTAVDSMGRIESNPAQTVEEVKEQEKIYAQLHEALVGKYGKLADVVTATHFGVGIDKAQWPALADYATGRSFIVPQKQAEEYAGLMQAANDLSRRDRYFHWELEFPEVFFNRTGEPKGDRAGFDAVIGNPPYVRQEQLAPFKPYFASTYPETFAGVADLYVYFYQQGLQLTRRGGRMSYIVTNKWMRAGYGERLRGYLATSSVLERIIDFGHAPIFENVDVFPCIVVLEKPVAQDDAGDITTHEVHVTAFPREVLHTVELGRYVRGNSHTVLQGRFTSRAWSLEKSAADDLMVKIHRAGVPLKDFANMKPYRGVLTGFNEAFLIDGMTRDRLVREDRNSIDIIKPYLRGQDIKRWSPEWQGLWMIFARRGIDIDAYPAIKRHLLRFREQLEPKPKSWVGDNWPGRKGGSYKWYEIQDSVEYWMLFGSPKITYQEIQFHSWFSMDREEYLTNNKAFILPTGDLYMLAVLNSPLIWWYNWRYLPHMKDEALSPVGELMIDLPIASPKEDARATVETAAERLIAITKANRESRRDTVDWLRTEFNIVSPGQHLEDFARLGLDRFIAEVRKRRPKGATVLSPATLKALRSGYTEQATPMQKRQAEAVVLERTIADVINAAYGLTPEDVDLMWATAPPRMPGAVRSTGDEVATSDDLRIR